jgi:mannose-6-phosphate isomerase-like protein (cupin superfamily)
MSSIAKIDLHREATSATGDWKNWVLTNVNDHVVRLSVMTRDFHWHRHTNSDEVLMPVEGSLIVDFEDQTMTVHAGEFVRVPRNVLHRTRPAGERVVTLSFEHKDTSVTGEE